MIERIVLVGLRTFSLQSGRRHLLEDNKSVETAVTVKLKQHPPWISQTCQEKPLQ